MKRHHCQTGMVRGKTTRAHIKAKKTAAETIIGGKRRSRMVVTVQPGRASEGMFTLKLRQLRLFPDSKRIAPGVWEVAGQEVLLAQLERAECVQSCEFTLDTAPPRLQQPNTVHMDAEARRIRAAMRDDSKRLSPADYRRIRARKLGKEYVR